MLVSYRLSWRRDISVDSDDAGFVGQLRALLRGAQTNEITLADFEQRFLHLHAEMPLSTPEPAAEAVEDLFWTVESYVGDPALRTPEDVDEQALGDAIDVCLGRLGP